MTSNTSPPTTANLPTVSEDPGLWDGCVPSDDVKDAASVRGLPPLYYVVPLALSLAVHFAVSAWSFSIPSVGALSGGYLRIALGIAIALFGAAIQVHGIRGFKRSGNTIGPHSSTASIIREGAFAYSRNPLYMGTAVTHLGIAISIGSVWALASVVVAVVLIRHWAIGPEERYLEDKFGDDYRAYKRQVRRWF